MTGIRRHRGRVLPSNEWEVYARTATQGSEFNIALSLPIKPIKLPH